MNIVGHIVWLHHQKKKSYLATSTETEVFFILALALSKPGMTQAGRSQNVTLRENLISCFFRKINSLEEYR